MTNKKHSESAHLRHASFEERESVYSSVKQCSLLLLVSISWKFYECPSGILWCRQQTRTKKIKKEPYAQGVIPIIPKMFQIVPFVIANISWKFHENTLIDFTVVLLASTHGAPRWETVKQSRQLWNSLTNHFLCRAWYFIKKSWKSVHPFFHNITNKHGSRKKTNRPRIQGVNRDIPKMFQISPCVKSVLFWKFHEHPFYRYNAAESHGFLRKSEKKVLCSRV